MAIRVESILPSSVRSIPADGVEPGIIHRIDIHVVDVMASDSAGTVNGVVGCQAVIYGLEKQIIVGGIDGITEIYRFSPAAILLFSGIENIISSHVVMAVGS